MLEKFRDDLRDSLIALGEALTTEDSGFFAIAVQRCWTQSNEATRCWPSLEEYWPAVGEPVRVAWIATPRAAEAALLLLQEARLAFDAMDDSIPRIEHRAAFQDAFREWHGWPKDRFDAIGTTQFLVAKIDVEFGAVGHIEIDDAWADAMTLLTDNQRAIVGKIWKSKSPIPSDSLTELVDSASPRDAIAKAIANINKRWKRTGFRVGREGRNPVRYYICGAE